MAGVSVVDSIRLLQLETAVGRGSMAVGVECHGGLGGIGIENTMVGGVVVYWVVSERARRISTRAYVEKKQVRACEETFWNIERGGCDNIRSSIPSIAAFITWIKTLFGKPYHFGMCCYY